MLIHQTPAEDSAAGQLQARTELVDITLASCAVDRYSEQEQLQSPFSLKLKYDGTGTSKATDLQVQVRFSLVAEDASKPSLQVFRIDCTFLVKYSVHGDAPILRDQLDAFSKANAVFNCWPYARELAQNMTVRMGEVVPPLPFLRIKTLPEATTKASTTASKRLRKKIVTKRALSRRKSD